MRGSRRDSGKDIVRATEQLGRPVLDKTEFPYHYDVTLQWQANPESSGPAISAALQQLGLKLEPKQISNEFLVIDHVETPSAD